MSLTYSEAITSIETNSENSGYGTSVNATLVITQQDGRTGFSEGSFVAVENRNQLSGTFGMSFNDRFSHDGSRFSASTTDQMTIQIEPVDSQNYRVHFTLVSWGNSQYIVNMQQAAQSNMLVGWGDTIGFGEGQAIYSLALTSAEGNLG